MKKIYVFTLIFLAVVTRGDPVYSQICDPVTPVFTVNLSGQPNGTWISPAIVRDGSCCGSSGSANCIEFIITLDPNATGINFNIASGAISGGSMFYQINCGPPNAVGSPICLSGPGPHLLTFCKPGNNTNTYAITSIPQPALNGTQWVSQACSGSMAATGLEDTSITWTSVPYNAVYNSYLSCTSGCNAVTVTPSGTLPAYVDYQVCGYVAGACLSAYFCDTIRINFVNNLAVAITPQNPVICFGGPNATVTANASGGLSPYNYLWNNGATTQSITVGAGTYIVGLQDSVSCSVTYDTVIVSALPSPISANAGLDQLLCTNQQSVNLGGSIIAATGGIWLGGSGLFSPDNVTLNATYTPSPGEIISGNVQLMLVTTGNSSCPADSDIIQITISPSPVPSISGSINVCAYSGATYTAPLVSGINYNWTVSGGNVFSTNNNTITVHWNTAGSGVITLTETNAAGCDSTITFPVTIHPKPVPVINGPLTVCTTTISQYSVANPVAGNTYSWSVTGGMISGSSNNSSVNVQWNTAGNATIAVTQSNSFGCDSTVSIPVTILTIPTPVINGPLNVCEFQTMTYSASYVSGNTYNWNVTGGTIIANNTNSITVNWPSSGNGTVTLTQANTLVCDSTVILNVIIGPQPIPVINGPQSVCTTTISQYTIANPVSGNTYSWSVAGGSISGSSNNSSVNVQWSTAGNATVTVTQSNSFGCDSTVTIPVTILTMPTPVISGTVNVCEFQTLAYSTPYVSGNTYNWNVTGGTIISNNNNSITVNWPAAGNGTITLTEANTLVCDSTVILNVIIGPQPVPVINGPQSVCTTTISQYTIANPVAGNSYSWSVTGGSISGSSNNSSVNVQWNTAGNATVTVTQSNSFGCDSTVTIPVTILTMPTPVISGTVNVCEFQTLAYSTPYVSGNTYNWNVTGGTIISNNNNSITVNWPAAGNGTITLTEANTLVCDSTVILNVIIGPQPVPVINGPQSVCTTTISQYTVANPVAGNSYNWSITGGSISGSSNNSSVNVQWNTAGNATVTVTQSNSFGCDSTVTIPVTILTMPTPVISGTVNVCEFQTLAYSTPYVSGNTYNWNVTGGTIISNNNNSITVNWPAAGNGTITLTEANTLVCDSTVILNVIIGPQPVPVINGPSLICTATYGQYAVSNPVVGDNYSWTTTGGTIIGSSTTDNITVLWTASGAGMVSVNVSNSFGCDSSVSYPVDVRLKPAPALNGLPVNCAMDTSTYSVQNIIGDTYIWNVTGGSIIGLSVGSSIEVLWTAPGTGEVNLRQISPDGCDSIVSKSVFINPLPQPVISGPLVICEDEPAAYNVPFVNSDFYNWTASPGNINGSTSTSIVNITWPNSGIGMVTMVQTTPQGCSVTTEFLTVINEKPHPSVIGSNLGCISNAQSNYSSAYEPGINYTWNVSGGSVTNGNGTSSITIEWSTPGINSISVTALNPVSGCDSTVTVFVNVDSLAYPVIQATGLTGCIPVKLDFNGNIINPNYHYTWNFGDGTSNHTANAYHVYATPGTYSVQLIAVNNTGCADTVYAEVKAYPIPVADFSLWHGTGPYYAGLSTLMIENHSDGASQYAWNFGDGTGSSLFEPQHDFTSPGIYVITLMASNQWGCSDSTTREIPVKVPEDIYIPNAFSPNNDHMNDYFSVEHNNITQLSVVIYNRWGERIYSSEDISFKWDGTFKSNPAQEGVYVYAIQGKGYHGKRFNLQGNVTLIR